MQAEMKVMTPNQLVFGVIRGMKGINFNREMAHCNGIGNGGQLMPIATRSETIALWFF